MQNRIIRSFEFAARHNSVAPTALEAAAALAAGTTAPDNSPDFLKEVLYELGKDVESIVGIHLTSNRRDLVFGYGLAGFTIDGKELMPDNCGAHFFMSGGATPAEQKFFKFLDSKDVSSPEPVGNGQFKIRYADSGSNAVVKADYMVTVALLLNLKE